VPAQIDALVNRNWWKDRPNLLRVSDLTTTSLETCSDPRTVYACPDDQIITHPSITHSVYT